MSKNNVRSQMGYRYFIFMMVILLSVTGCAFKAVSIYAPSPDFYSSQKRIAVAWIAKCNNDNLRCNSVELESPRYYMKGPQALFAVLATKALVDNNIKKSLESENIDPLVNKFYLYPFSKELELKGFTVIQQKDAFNEGYMNKHKKIDYETRSINVGSVALGYVNNINVLMSGKEDFIVLWKYDFSEIVKMLEVDYLMILQIDSIGVRRWYSDYFPVSEPEGWSRVRTYIVSAASGEVIGDYSVSLSVLSRGDWDNPPEYRDLMEAVRLSFERVMAESFLMFFNKSL